MALSPPGLIRMAGKTCLFPPFSRTVRSKSHSPKNLLVTREEIWTSTGTSCGRGTRVAADSADPGGSSGTGKGTVMMSITQLMTPISTNSRMPLFRSWTGSNFQGFPRIKLAGGFVLLQAVFGQA